MTQIWETIMRFTPAACVAALILTGVSSAVFAEKPIPVVINPIAQDMIADAQKLAKAGDRNKAADLLETALAVDPRASAAYTGLAELAKADGMPGKAISYYGEAIALNPDDRRAIAGQGVIFAERGAKEKAALNLKELRRLCRWGCAEMKVLKQAISKGMIAETQSVEAITPQPIITETAPKTP
jgi:hypothetical protein